MLVLSRKPDESFYVGDNIKITVHEIRGNKVRIGIEAPRDIPIYREELKFKQEGSPKVPVDRNDIEIVKPIGRNPACNLLDYSRKEL